MVELHHADTWMHDRRTRNASADRGRSHVEIRVDLGGAVFLRRHYYIREIERLAFGAEFFLCSGYGL